MARVSLSVCKRATLLLDKEISPVKFRGAFYCRYNKIRNKKKR